MVCIHGFTDTWRSWELVLPSLQDQHDVLAPTLTGHMGGPPMEGEISEEMLVEGVERAMDEAGFETAHIVGNSLGGYVALQLAARGRAESVVALAPAGGWAEGDESYRDTLAFFVSMQEQMKAALPHAEALLSTPEGRRMATAFTVENYEHIPTELLLHQFRGAVGCDAAAPLIEFALENGWSLAAEKIDCPLRIVWGTEDKILAWPRSAAGYRNDLFPNADWIELDGIGHCPQLDVPLEAAQLIRDFTR